MNDWYFVISCFLSRYLRTPYFRHSPLNKIKEVAMLLMTPRTWRAFATVAVLLALAACTQAPSWQKLLTAKIVAQYPGYEVQPVPDGNVIVRRPGQADVPIDVNAIAQFCLRGTRDCDYATDQMLLELAPPRK